MEFILNNVYLPLEQDESNLPSIISKMIKVEESYIVNYRVLKKAVDSRNKNRILFVYSLQLVVLFVLIYLQVVNLFLGLFYLY